MCTSVINYTKNGEKYTSQRMMQIRTLSKSSMFIQYRRVDSMLCASVCACVWLCVCVCVCVCACETGTRVGVRKNTGLTLRIGAKIYSEKNSVRI